MTDRDTDAGASRADAEQPGTDAGGARTEAGRSDAGGARGPECRLGILISGRGSNMVALAEAVAAGRVPGARVAVVLSDKAAAAGLELARARGIEAVAVERRGRTREEHEREIVAALRERGVTLVCLAGFMRLLSPGFVAAFAGRVLNVHPSLLPAFPGLEAQRQAIEHGVKVSGCTVHFVDETLDSGPILLQRAVAVLDSDTPATLAARILREEHLAYPEAVALVASGAYRLEGRVVKRETMDAERRAAE